MANTSFIQEYLDNPAKLKEQDREVQLAVMAELELYFAEEEAKCYETGKKERDPATKLAVARKNYWRRQQQNMRELINNETVRIQRGLM